VTRLRRTGRSIIVPLACYGAINMRSARVSLAGMVAAIAVFAVALAAFRAATEFWLGAAAVVTAQGLLFASKRAVTGPARPFWAATATSGGLYCLIDKRRLTVASGSPVPDTMRSDLRRMRGITAPLIIEIAILRKALPWTTCSHHRARSPRRSRRE
jgi:hypothetical protein